MEDKLLAQGTRAIIGKLRPRQILEPGSGTSRKTQRLFDACRSERCHSEYTPFDVWHAALLETGQALMMGSLYCFAGDWITYLLRAARCPLFPVQNAGQDIYDARVMVFAGIEAYIQRASTTSMLCLAPIRQG